MYEQTTQKLEHSILQLKVFTSFTFNFKIKPQDISPLFRPHFGLISTWPK